MCMHVYSMYVVFHPCVLVFRDHQTACNHSDGGKQLLNIAHGNFREWEARHMEREDTKRMKKQRLRPIR